MEEQETTPDYSSKVTEEGDGAAAQDDAIAEWEASAKKIAEKVQRQQEGKETAMLPKEHEDETFLTVDEIAKLLDAQLTENAKGKSAFFRSANSKERRRSGQLVHRAQQIHTFTPVVRGTKVFATCEGHHERGRVHGFD